MRRGWFAFSMVVLLAVAAGLVSFRQVYEPDLWWHLAQGRETAAGRVVRTNLFSSGYSAYPQQYTSWLFDWGAYELWRLGGGAAIQGAQALLIAGALGFAARACRLRASLPATLAVTIVGWLILEPRAMPRPHLVSFAALGLTAYLIERSRVAGSARPLLWFIPLIVTWANAHLECVFGIAMVGLYGAAEGLRPSTLTRRESIAVVGIATASLVAAAATPYGFGLFRYLYENSLVPQVIGIAELQPPYWPNYRAFFLWGIALAAILLLRRGQVTLAEAVTIILFGALGLRYLRLTPLLFFASAPLAARALDALRASRIDPRLAVAAAMLLAIFFGRVPMHRLAATLEVGTDALTPPAIFSTGAIAFARQHDLRGPVFTSMNLGGFVAWELYPAAQVFQDARLQAYPSSHFRDILAASRSPERWARLTDGVDWAMVSLSRVNDLSGVGRFNPTEWGIAYRDAAVEILVRRDGRYGRLAAPTRSH
jgi:hypothetical protein